MSDREKFILSLSFNTQFNQQNVKNFFIFFLFYFLHLKFSLYFFWCFWHSNAFLLKAKQQSVSHSNTDNHRFLLFFFVCALFSLSRVSIGRWIWISIVSRKSKVKSGDNINGVEST